MTLTHPDWKVIGTGMIGFSFICLIIPIGLAALLVTPPTGPGALSLAVMLAVSAPILSALGTASASVGWGLNRARRRPALIGLVLNAILLIACLLIMFAR